MSTNCNKPEYVSRRATRTTEIKLFDAQLKESGMLSLQKRRVRNDMTDLVKYLKGCHKKDGANLCPFELNNSSTM